jgi:hypothetical protein
MNVMSFGHLDKATRRSLKAIRKEFGRCADVLPFLTHGRLSTGRPTPTGVNEFFEFDKYRDSHTTDELDDLYGRGDWEWEDVCDPEFEDGTNFSLGIYLGRMDHIERYQSLATSAYSVLMDGPIKKSLGLPSFQADLTEDKSLQWNWLLHHFSEYGIPLLEVHEGETSLREIRTWCLPRQPWLWESFVLEPDAMRLRPVRPQLWFLAHGIFVASIAVINVLLDPFNTLTLTGHLESSILKPLMNNDCELDQSVHYSVPPEDSTRTDRVSDSKSEMLPNNYLHFDGEFWEIQFSTGAETVPQRFPDNIGFHHLAKLLNSPSKSFSASDLIDALPRSTNDSMSMASLREVASEMVLRGELSDKANQIRFEKSEDDQNEEIRNWVNNLKAQLLLAKAADDLVTSERLENQIAETASLIRSVKGKAGELRVNTSLSQKKNDKNRVAVALKRAIEKVEVKMPALAKHLKQCQNSTWGFCYESPPHCHWHVAIAPRSSSRI